MIRKRHQTLAAFYLLFDVLASGSALLLAYFLRFKVQILPVTKGIQPLEMYLQILPLVMVIFPLSFAVQGLYVIRPTRSRAEEWPNVAIGTIVGTVLLSGILLWIRPPRAEIGYSRAMLAMFSVCVVLLVVAIRTVMWHVVGWRHRRGRDLDRVLIAGNGDLARAVAGRIAAHRELGFDLVGYVANGEPGDVPSLERLGTVEQAPEVVRRKKIDHVFVALPHHSSTAMLDLLDKLVRECVSIHVVPDLLQFMALRSRVEDLDGLPTINLTETPLDGWSRIVKRFFDFAIASAALIVLSPLMLLVALLIWLEDRGPIFYRQERMGLDGVPFEILKFRSMSQAAESSTGAVWATKDDPRRTRIGSFIRTWSIDELPQLWNVIRGEMSLVGPRPERPQFVEQFRAEYPHYMLRHRVQAGMTGWAQVHGWRGNTSMRERIEHDLYYIENWSLLLDFKILLMTIRHGFKHENAY